MRTEIVKAYKNIVLPLLFIMTILTFFFDFVSLKINNTNTALTGFDLLKNEGTTYGIWLVMVLLFALVGFVISWVKGKIKYGIGFLLALAGIIFLLVAQFSIIKWYDMTNKGIENLTFETAYWLCLGIFVIAGSRCYLLQFMTTQKKEKIETKGVVNINIITHSNKGTKNN